MFKYFAVHSSDSVPISHGMQDPGVCYVLKAWYIFLELRSALLIKLGFCGVWYELPRTSEPTTVFSIDINRKCLLVRQFTSSAAHFWYQLRALGSTSLYYVTFHFSNPSAILRNNILPTSVLDRICQGLWLMHNWFREWLALWSLLFRGNEMVVSCPSQTCPWPHLSVQVAAGGTAVRVSCSGQSAWQNILC